MTPNEQRLSDRLLGAALTVPVLLWTVLLVAALTRLIGVTGPSANIATLLLSLLLIWSAGFSSIGSKYLPPTQVPLVLLIAVPGALVCAQIFDFSVDGMGYHIPAIADLMLGWNPGAESSGLYWQDVYPNGAWTIGAVFGTLTGSPEAAKIINWLTLLSGSVLVFFLLFRQAGSFGIVTVALSFAIVFQPVAIQLMNFNMIDSAVYYCCLGLACCLVLHFEYETQGALFSAACYCGLLASFKTSGLYYAFVVCAVIFSLSISRFVGNPRDAIISIVKDRVQSASIILPITLLSVLWISFRPYVTNIIDHGAVLPERVSGTISKFRPENLIDEPSITYWFHAVFGRTFHNHRASTELKYPFDVSSAELSLSSYIFSHGGFGPLMGTITVLALGIFIIALAKRWFSKAEKGSISGALLVIAFSFFLGSVFFSEGWFARYISVFWAIPFLILAAVLPPKVIERAKGRIHFSVLGLAALSLCVLSMMNTYVTAYGSWKYTFTSSKLFGVAVNDAIQKYDRSVYIVSERNPDFNSERVWKLRFEDHGIEAKIVPADSDCSNPVRLPAWPAKVCYGDSDESTIEN